jgi:hypothetical protein
MSTDYTGREKVPTAKRDERLEMDNHTCQFCRGSEADPDINFIEVHHKDPDPEDGDRHAIENLITLCHSCHSWMHKRPDGEGLDMVITDADRQALLGHDFQILRVLEDAGPLSTGELTDKLPEEFELTTQAIRDRLLLLMGLDYEVEDREDPLADKDATTGEWGLPEQIDHSVRGRIPDDHQALIQRVRDERIRRALKRGCDRATIAEVFDVTERTIFRTEVRAQAYDLPLAALEHGRATSTDTAESGSESASDSQDVGTTPASEAATEGMQQDLEALGTVEDGSQELDAVNRVDGETTASEESVGPEASEPKPAATDGGDETDREIVESLEDNEAQRLREELETLLAQIRADDASHAE